MIFDPKFPLFSLVTPGSFPTSTNDTREVRLMHQTPAAAISKGIPLSEAELQQRKIGGFDGDWTVWSMKKWWV